MAKARQTAGMASHSKPVIGSNQPINAAILITSKGTKTRKPQAALKPIPIYKPRIVSMLLILEI